MPSPQLTFGVLGALEVRRDAAPVPLFSFRQRAVLTALLVQVGRPVPGDVLIDAAWGDELPVTPRAALNTVLSRLRGALGSDSIRSEPTGYRLGIDHDAVDAVRFETLLRRARDAPARTALRMLEGGLGLWRGRAYAEFADRDFAAAEAVRLEELRLACVEDLAELRIDVGEITTAVATLEAFIEEHPLRERARGLLMSGLYRGGRVTEALESYQDYRRLLVDELGLDPSPTLRELQQRILSHGVDPAAPPRPATRPPAVAHWPMTDAAFLGRDREAAELVEHATQHRLVTVTGVGGVGKTRLVAETLPALAEGLTLPATVVELASVAEPGADGGVDGRVEMAVASALNVGPATGGVREAVLDYLSVVPVLLILDNCEHVLTHVRPFVQAALRRCPGMRVVTTSRQRIGLPAEQVLPLEPLPTPSIDSTAAELTAAVQLFTDRVRRVSPAFALAGATALDVAEICRRLDGLPLAIELAATRAATLGTEPLLKRLDHSLDLLGEDGKVGERSLRATIEWSYGLLDEDDRLLFVSLGVFEGNFTLDGAEKLVGGLVRRPVPVGLTRLAEASLVMALGAAHNDRYRLLQIVRAFARERLAETAVEPDVRLAHARWVRSVVQAAAEAAVQPGDAVTAAMSSEMDADAASIRVAVAWAMRAGQAQLAGEITGALMLATMHGQLRADLIDIVRQVAEDPAVHTTPAGRLARAAGAFAAVLQGDLQVGERAARAVHSVAQGVDEHYLALCALGVATLYRGDYDSSRHWWRQLLTIDGLPLARQVDGHASLALIASYDRQPDAQRHAARAAAVAEAAGSQTYRAFARYAEAEVAATADYSTGVPLLAIAAREIDRTGSEFTGGLATAALAAALTRLDRTAEALDVLAPLVERWLRLAAWPQLWTTLRLLAELLARNDRPEEAALLLAAADRAPSAPSIAGGDTELYTGLVETLNERLDPEAHQKIVTLAAVMPRTQVVDRARAAVSAMSALSAESAGPAGPAGKRADPPVGRRPEDGAPGRVE